MMTINQVVVSMTLRIKNNNNSRSCDVKRPLDDESLVRKYLTLSLKFLAGQRNQTIFLGQNNLGDKTIILGHKEYNVPLKN